MPNSSKLVRLGKCRENINIATFLEYNIDIRIDFKNLHRDPSLIDTDVQVGASECGGIDAGKWRKRRTLLIAG